MARHNGRGAEDTMKKTAFYSEWRARMAGHARLDDRGAALITALVFLVLLTLLGMASLMTSGTELLISRNDRLNKLALDHANAGVSMAVAALDKKDIGGDGHTLAIQAVPANKTKEWKVSFDHYSTNAATLVTYDIGSDPANGGIDFTTTVRYRPEDSLHTNGTGDVDEIVGYSNDFRYNKSPFDVVGKSYPVYEITSVGRVRSGNQVIATATVVMEVTKNALLTGVPASLTVEGSVTGGGSSDIIGDPAYPSIQTGYANGYSGTVTNGMAPVAGVSSTLEQMLGMDVADLIAEADITSPDPPTWPIGSLSVPKIVYVNNGVGDEWNMNAGEEGWGILIVQGDARTNGTAKWHGLVVVLGSLTLAGTYNFDGPVIVRGDADIIGSGQLADNRALLDDISNVFSKSKIINWRRDYN